MFFKRFQKIIFLSLLFFVFSFTTYASELINAGLLKNIWYSNNDVYEGENVKIITGIYNQSTTTFSGTISFYVDNQEISKKDFLSKPDSLIDVSSVWLASSTRVSVKAKILEVKITSLNSEKSISADMLYSSQTNDSSISINKKITLDEVKSNITEVATNIVKVIDEKANDLSQEILSLKKPVEEDKVDITKNAVKQTNGGSVSTSTNFVSKIIGDVLGAETKYENKNTSEEIGLWQKIKKNNISTYLYNKSLDFLSIVVKYWKITSFALVALFIIFKFFI